MLGKVLRAGKCYDNNFKGCWARTVTRPKKLLSSEIEHFFNQLSYFDSINHPDKYFLGLLNNAIVKVNLNVYSIMGPNQDRILGLG